MPFPPWRLLLSSRALTVFEKGWGLVSGFGKFDELAKGIIILVVGLLTRLSLLTWLL